MMDEEACLPEFTSETDSFESSDAEEYLANNLGASCNGHESYIKKLELAINHLTGGKNVSNMPAGETLLKLGGIHEAKRPEDMSPCEIEYALYNGAQKADPIYHTRTADPGSGQSLAKSLPMSENNDTERRFATLEDRSPTLLVGDTEQAQASSAIIVDQQTSALAIPTKYNYSSLLKDESVGLTCSRSLQTNETTNLGSTVMPPNVAAMWDTEVDGELFDVSVNSFSDKDLSAHIPPKLGLMGGARHQNLQPSTGKVTSGSALKPKAPTKKVVKTAKSRKPTSDSEGVDRARLASTTIGAGPSKSTNDFPFIRNDDMSPRSARRTVVDKGKDKPDGTIAKGQALKYKIGALPASDPFEEEWHGQGPSQIYLPDSHYAINMMSAEVEWDLAQGMQYPVRITHSKTVTYLLQSYFSFFFFSMLFCS